MNSATHSPDSNLRSRGDSTSSRSNSTSCRGNSTSRRGNCTSRRGNSTARRSNSTARRSKASNNRRNRSGMIPAIAIEGFALAFFAWLAYSVILPDTDIQLHTIMGPGGAAQHLQAATTPSTRLNVPEGLAVRSRVGTPALIASPLAGLNPVAGRDRVTGLNHAPELAETRPPESDSGWRIFRVRLP